MSGEKSYQQENEIVMSSVGSESNTKTAHPITLGIREPESTLATASDISSNSGHPGDNSNGPFHLNHGLDPDIGIPLSVELDAKRYFQEQWDFRIHNLLESNVLLQPYSTCISYTRRLTRCRTFLGRENIQLANQKIMELRAHFPKDIPSETDLAELSTLLLCNRYHKCRALEVAKAWKGDLSISSQQNAIPVTEEITPISIPRKLPPISMEQPILREQPSSIISAIVEAIMKPLSPRDNDGFIYICTQREKPSMIKIGAAWKIIDSLDYSRRCHFNLDGISWHWVQHYKRVEQLIHYSLKEYRIEKLTCDLGEKCGLYHREWFEIDRKVAGSIVHRWQAWMKLNPYNSSRLDPFWKVNLFEAEQLPSLDAFTQWLDHMTQCCIEKGEESWRGRTDGQFRNCNGKVADKILVPPISPTTSITSSDVPSLTSETTASSTLSKEQIAGAVDTFVAWLLKDEVIQSLQAIAVDRIGAEMFEKQLCRFLRKYSKHLQADAQTPSELRAARFVRTNGPNIANCLRSHTNPEWEEKSRQLQNLLIQKPDKDELMKRFEFEPVKPPLPMATFNVDAHFESPGLNPTVENQRLNDIGWDDSDLENIMDDVDVNNMERDDSEYGEADMLSLPDLGLVREFMIESEAFDKLRDNLKGSVFPQRQYILKDLVGMETQELIPITDMDIESFPVTSENQISVKGDSYTGTKENKIFGGISEVPATDSADISDKNKVALNAISISKDCSELDTNRASVWKFEEYIKLSALKGWLKAKWSHALRPRVKPGFRRIEWTCECGETLYGDFDNSNPQAVNQLATELQSSTSKELLSSQTPSSYQGGLKDSPQHTSNLNQSISHTSNQPTTDSMDNELPPTTLTALATAISDPQYLALCVNIGNRKTLAEVEVSDVVSDADLFSRLKSNYIRLRGYRNRFSFLVRPVAIRFVKFNLFGLQEGLVALCDPNESCSLPPADVREYYYHPIPFKSPPPMPSRVFIHYLDHGSAGDMFKTKHFTPRIPKRLKQRLIDCPVPIDGWGIYIIEGPNKSGVFWITIITMFASIAASVLWSSLRDDIQGGTGLGSIIIAMPPVIMTAFLYRYTAE